MESDNCVVPMEPLKWFTWDSDQQMESRPITAVPEKKENPVQIQTVWDEGSSVPASYVNEMLMKVLPGADGGLEAIAILFGRVEAPNVSGTPEDQQAALAAISSLPIEVVTKIVISPARLRIFADVLSGFAQKLEEAAK